jgi:hypothetical protein
MDLVEVSAVCDAAMREYGVPDTHFQDGPGK